MKKWGWVALVFLLLAAGCGAKGTTAEEHGSGLSVEFTSDNPIRHVQLILFKNGKRLEGESVINADGSPFGQGEVIWFDLTEDEWEGANGFAIAWSEDESGKGARTTKMEKIPDGTAWVNAKFNERDGLTVEEAK
ncbi:hypothetical protein ACFFIY_02305 [Bhargavaea ullalensis]|uniref:Uncharacterized protein n=1 Tax=Bhargavaea ullalensis TaxID=1265685 RepID=A0ABV2GBV4_9BACL